MPSELNPESWTKNFRGFIMRKIHDYEARLKYMKMLEEGYSIHFISRAYGIDHRILSTLWSRYKKEGPVALFKKKNCALTVAEKLSVISEYKEKRLSLPDIMLSYGVSRSAIEGWCRRYAAGGEEYTPEFDLNDKGSRKLVILLQGDRVSVTVDKSLIADRLSCGARSWRAVP